MKQKAKDRKQHILGVALVMAKEVGYQHIRRDELARCAGVAQGTINLYFSTMAQLKRAVMRRAVAVGDLSIIAQGLAMNDPIALKAEPQWKQAATEWLGSL